MNRIREGNDFDLVWVIKRGGTPEDFTNAYDVKFSMIVYRRVIDVTLPENPFTGNVLSLNIPKEITPSTGDYRLVLEYTLPDSGQFDGNLKCKTDVDGFRIVPLTAEADYITTINVASDVAIGLRGDKGLKGDDSYQIWIDLGNEGTYADYIAYLRAPAVDAGGSIAALKLIIEGNESGRATAEGVRNAAETLRGQAETSRLTAETGRSTAEGLRDEAKVLRIAAEGLRDENETDRINAEGDRVDAEDLRDQAEAARANAETARANAEGDETKGRVKAENERVTAEVLRDETEGLRELAEIARANAEGDATKGRVKAENDRVNAEILRNETFGQKMNDADDKIEEMDGTLSTYDGRVTQVESDIVQLAGDVSLLDAIQSAKIKDIENVLSTANLGQSAQLSVSGVSPLSLPKNAANGGMSVKLEGLTENVGGVITHFEPTGRVRSVGKNLFKLNPFISTQSANGVEMIQGGYSTSMLNYQTSYNNGVYAFLQNKSVVAKISNIKFEVGKQYTIQSKSYIGNGTVAYNRITIFHTDGTSVTGYNHLDGSAIVVTSSQGKTVQYITFSNYGANGFYGNYPVNSIMVERSVRSSAFESFRDAKLYLTAPELKSVQKAWDEIRKGSNSYEHVKRIMSKTLAAGDITSLVAGTNTDYVTLPFRVFANWHGASSTGTTGLASVLDNRFTKEVAVSGFDLAVNAGSYAYGVVNFILIFAKGTYADLAAAKAGLAGITINYKALNPIISPISFGGILNSAENGTVYHEPIIADAGVCDTKMDILLTDYLISALEEIIVHKDGIDTYLDVSTAVIAADKLSFTHPSLASGDLVLFTYAFDKESTNGNITATFYDSNVVKIDTVTGKAYRINEVVTNGVLTRTLTEV